MLIKLRKIKVSYIFVDFLIAILSFYTPYILRYNCYSFYYIFAQFKPFFIKESSLIFVLWFTLIVFHFLRTGLYNIDTSCDAKKEFSEVIKGIFFSSMVAIVAIFLLQYKFFSRIVLLECFLVAFITLAGWRIARRLIINRLKAGAFNIKEPPKVVMNQDAFVSEKIDGLIRIFLYIMIAILPFSKAAIEVCFVIALVLWVIKRLFIKRNILPIKSALSKPITAFIIAGILSTIFSVDFKVSFFAFFTKFMEGILLYFFIIEVMREKKHIFIIITLLILSSVVVSIDGIIQGFFTGFDIFRHVPMVRGGITAAFNHKNDLGGYLLFPFLVIMSLVWGRMFFAKSFRKTRTDNLILLILVMLLCLLGLIISITNSRGALISLILGVLFLNLIMSRKLFIGAIVSALLFFSVLFIVAPKARFEDGQLNKYAIVSDVDGRLKSLEPALRLINDRPIFGNGLNTYMQASRKYTSSLMYAHNCYLQIAAEMGIVGLICFLYVLKNIFSVGLRTYLYVLSTGAKVINNSLNSKLVCLEIGLLSALFSFLLHSAIDTNLYSLQLNALFWYMIGLIVCLCNQLTAVKPLAE